MLTGRRQSGEHLLILSLVLISVATTNCSTRLEFQQKKAATAAATTSNNLANNHNNNQGLKDVAASSRPAAIKTQTSPTGNNNQSTAGAVGLNINYETKWFVQLVDHFGWANQDTWMQRYLVNSDHWCGANCPILFYCGNEGDIEVFTNNTGWMWENAEKLHAMLVFAEHRFYGQSMPYKIDPTRVSPHQLPQLGYLSSEQALADYAKLIYELRHTLYQAEHSPIITVGGSYGGMLAAWMRMKYPNAVQGALAGSAPILQFPDEYDCQAFNKIVSQDYENYSPNCSKAIWKSWSAMRELSNELGGLAKLSNIFKTCQPLVSTNAANSYNVDQLAQMLASIWVNMAMTDYANEATFLSKMPALPIKHACSYLNLDYLDASNEQLMEGISKASQIYTNYTGNLACLDMGKLLFDPMDVLWDFQSCTEMVMPICSNGVDDMFDPQPFNLSQFVRDCKGRWGVQTQVNKVKLIYGDTDSLLASTSRIIFSSCSRDPWSAGCPQKSNEANQVYALKIPGVCHHEDLRPSGPNDSAELKKARETELNIITDWIQKHYEEVRKFSHTIVWKNADNKTN